MTQRTTTKWWHAALLAGFAGGLAEIIWLSLYSTAAVPLPLRDLARQVTVSLFPSLVNFRFAVSTGVAIHMILAMGLALVFVRLVWVPFASRLGGVGVALISLATLFVVWTVNFFAVLPVLNPEFLRLVPLGVALISKLLFGISMALTLPSSRPAV